MGKFIKNLGGCLPFRRHRKKNHSLSLTISPPIQKEDVNPKTVTKIPISDNLLEKMDEHAKKLIMNHDLIALIEKIKSVIDTQGFSVETLVIKDDLFRRLTTRLQIAGQAKDPFFKEKVYPYLYENLLKDNKIRIVDLGDPRIYNEGLNKLDPQHLDKLKEKLFTTLSTLQDLITSHPSYPLTESQTSVKSHLSIQPAKRQDDARSVSGLDQFQRQKSIKTPKTGFVFFNPGYDQGPCNEQEENYSSLSYIIQKKC